MNKAIFIFILLIFCSIYCTILRNPFTYSSKDLLNRYRCTAIGKVHLTDKMFAIVLCDGQLKTVTQGDKLNQNMIVDILDDSIIIQDERLNELRIELDKN